MLPKLQDFVRWCPLLQNWGEQWKRRNKTHRRHQASIRLSAQLRLSDVGVSSQAPDQPILAFFLPLSGLPFFRYCRRVAAGSRGSRAADLRAARAPHPGLAGRGVVAELRKKLSATRSPSPGRLLPWPTGTHGSCCASFATLVVVM